ncbi:hypothetical protein GTU79_10205 [Sodalis ligni]|uniref:hypothetical protein n=1 Tax=Sodalis ligni TaxID=2697027 RepID=UPI001BDE15D5|nr:hypothetical protein [Sodalis ligni]QWA13003.1 hypothetical protein GTU79_10205 [Sodalis ligni]
MKTIKPIAITVGDPAGTGPELSLKVASTELLMPRTPVVLIGSAGLLRRVADHIGLEVEIRTVERAEEAKRQPGVVWVMDVPSTTRTWSPAASAKSAARHRWMPSG